MAERLTPNAIGAVMAGDVDLKPLVQALDIVRMMAAGGKQERYRVTISDGVHSHQAVLASQLNDLAKGHHLRRGSVLQLIDYTCSSVQGRRYLSLSVTPKRWGTDEILLRSWRLFNNCV